ncbi:hypothetical protein SDIAM103S_00102 [Streptomyces diastaticus subsp. diastaticus]
MKRARPGGTAALVLSLVAALLLSGLGAGGAGAAERPWWEPVDRPAPDSRIDVSGEPFTGTDANGDVRGFVDTHNHLMTNEAFGGKLVCGKPFSDKGVADALKDCPEHYPDGAGALLENLTVDPDGHHDPVGWPTFEDWPSSTTMSHQQNYYAWLERAWRAASVSWSRTSRPTASSARSTYATGAVTRWSPSACRPRRPTRCRTTSTRCSAVPARAGSGS